MSTKTAPRRRLARPGVKILHLADGRYVARFKDALTGKQQQQSLDKLGLTNAEARRRWAINKANALMEMRAVITSGGAVAVQVPLDDAIDEFLKGYTKPKTIEGHTTALKRFAAWAASVGIRLAQDLTGPHLARWRDHYAQDNAATATRGGTRGAKKKTARRRSPASVNKVLTVTKTFLGWARRRGWLPYLNTDSILDNLRPLKLPIKAIEFLPPKQLDALLEAALRHDNETFAMTRAEHAAAAEVGTTPRYPAVAPFVLSCILTGCRFQELVGLRWSEVDLDQTVIRLPADRVKTGHARTIQLTETPSMVSLLRNLQETQKGDLVFDLTADQAKAAHRRLMKDPKSPSFTWQCLRRTCGTILTNAPGIYGGASAFMSAKRLGHSVAIAERHYAGILNKLPAKAKTLEAAASIEDLANSIASLAGVSHE